MLAWLGRWVAGSFGWVGGVMELLGVPQQNAHSVLPREGAKEGVENGRVIGSTSTECTFCTPQRGCRGGAGLELSKPVI